MMKLDTSFLDKGSSKLHAELELPRLEGTDLDTGTFALPAVHDVSLARPGSQRLSVRAAGVQEWAVCMLRPTPDCARCAARRTETYTHACAACPTQIDSFEREVVEMVKPNHGTTTLGFIFKQGVIIAVDSRATMGSYICERQPCSCLGGGVLAAGYWL
jgi:hypothetical protein